MIRRYAGSTIPPRKILLRFARPPVNMSPHEKAKESPEYDLHLV